MAQLPNVRHVELIGSGPFVLPLLTSLVRLEVPEEKDVAVPEFLSHDGKRIFAAISYRALEQFVTQQSDAPLDRSPFQQSIVIDLSVPADAYELPEVVSYDGYFFRAPNWRTLIFSTAQKQKLLFPFQVLTYDGLLAFSKASLMFYNKERRRH